MGTWGSGLFDDDLSADVKNDFEDFLKAGGSTADAEKHIKEKYKDSILDPDESPVVVLSLASLEIDHRYLSSNLRDLALMVINQGLGLERWAEAGEEQLAERKALYTSLKEKIEKSTK